MKRILYLLTGLCLLVGIFTCCEKKSLDEDNPNGGGSGNGGSSLKGTIEGVVTDKDTDRPIVLASVTLQATNTMTLTDTAGHFTLSNIEPGTYKLQFKRNGYSTHTSEDIKVEGGKTVRYNAVLESLSADLQILDADGQVISELNLGASSKCVFVLKNAGKEIVEWEIPKLATDWVTGFSKQSGKLAPDASESVEVSIDRDKLSDGANEATLYIGSNVGDKQLLIKTHVSRSFCFTDESGEELFEAEFSDITQQYRFKIKNTGSDALTWELAAIDWNDWLQFVGKTSGKLAAGEAESRTLKVNYDPGEGTHETRIKFSSNGGEKTLPVKLKIERSCRLEDKNGNEISELNLEQLTNGSFKIRNTGSGNLKWEILSVDADWLTLGNKKSGTLQPGAAETISITIDASRLTEGDNQTTVNISTGAGNKQLQIRAYRLQLSDILPEMVYVEGGTFLMGTGSGHEVTLDNFYIGKYEITQLQWEFVMGTNPSYFKGAAYPVEDYPVEAVYWNEAVQFCEKLSQLTGKTYRLPTEAEWEYAARGGKHADSTQYAGSNNINEVAWYNGNSGQQTHPVGKKQPNGLGIYDMSGNVFEWCSDQIGWMRGGSWFTEDYKCRVSYSVGSGSAYTRYSNQGFRIVREP